MNVQESLGKYWKDRAEWGLALPKLKHITKPVYQNSEVLASEKTDQWNRIENPESKMHFSREHLPLLLSGVNNSSTL